MVTLHHARVAVLALSVALATILGWQTSAVAQQPVITATVDRQQMTLDEALRLEIRVEGVPNAQIGDPEGTDFEVIGRRASTSMTIVNGRVGGSVRMSMTLRPLRAGKATIGRIAIQTTTGTRFTDPIAVEVLPAAAGQTRQPPGSATAAPTAPVPGPIRPQPPQQATRRPLPSSWPAGSIPAAPLPGSPELFTTPPPSQRAPGEPFVVARLNESDPVVGQQVIVDYLVYVPIQAFNVEAVSMSEPEFSGFWFQDSTEQRTIGGRRNLGREQVQGELFEVSLMRSFTLVPLRAGELVIPSLELVVAVHGGFFDNPGQITARTPPIVLRVGEVPTEDKPPGALDTNVGRFAVVARSDVARARVGDAIVVSWTWEGAGLLSRLVLPDPPTVTGARAFDPDDRPAPRTLSTGWLGGTITRSMTLVPQSEGLLEIPAVSFPHWDPWTGKWQVARSEKLVIQVQGMNPTRAQEPADGAAANRGWLAELPAPRDPVAPARGPGPFDQRPWLPLAIAAVPLLGALARDGTRRLRARADARREHERPARAAEVARARLDAIDPSNVTDAARDVAAVLRDYAEAITGEPCRGRPLPRLAEALVRVTSTEGADAVRGAVEAAEAARFGGDLDLAALVDRARTALDRAEEGRR